MERDPAKQKRSASTVRPLAEKIAERLAPACERIEVAGSLRRQATMVSDIELVLITKVTEQPDGLFKSPKPAILPVLAELEAQGKLRLVKGQLRYRRYQVLTAEPWIGLDLFITMPKAWGYQLAIRTGPKDYSRWLVTQRSRGGGLADGYACADGMVWRTETRHTPSMGERVELAEPVAVPEERDFFDLIAGGYVDPPLRAVPTVEG